MTTSVLGGTLVLQGNMIEVRRLADVWAIAVQTWEGTWQTLKRSDNRINNQCNAQRGRMKTKLFSAFVAALAVSSLVQADSNGTLLVKQRDTCDPLTFNARIGPGTCIGEFHTTFDEFVAELTQDATVGAWRFQPLKRDVKPGTQLIIQNLGGEVHTFTRVNKFGGGVVPILNDLSKNPVVAPECTAEPSASSLFVPAKQTLFGEIIGVGETVKYQCCIHPWMRTVIRGK